MSTKAHIIWILIVILGGIMLFSLAAKKMEEMQGPRVAPLFQQTVVEGSLIVRVTDPEVFKMIGTTTIVVDEDLLEQIKGVQYDSASLESQTIFLD